MYATIRRYKGNLGIADEFTRRSEEVTSAIGKAPGFIAYYAVKTAEGITSVTVCEARTGAEESNRIAADWIKQYMPSFTSQPPEVLAGDVIVTTTAKVHA